MRCRVDRLWLCRVAVVIQSAMRRAIARTYVAVLRRDLSTAAVRIQRRYRQWVARRLFGERLWEREIRYRSECVHRTASAVVSAEDELVKMAKRLNKARLIKKTEALVDDVFARHNAVFDLQRDMVEMRRQLETASPRSQQMGWTISMAEDLQGLRGRLTDMKLDCIFNVSSELAKLDAILEAKVEDIEATVRRRNKFNRWREAEESRLYKIVHERGAAARAKLQVMDVASERRKWRVVHYTRNGKPLKSHNNSKSGSDRMSKATYSAGCDVDLLAGSRPISAPHADTSVTVNESISKYSLKVYHEQVALYEKLLNPISEILGTYLSKVQMSSGYGAEGVQFTNTLANIGAISLSPSPPLQVTQNLIHTDNASRIKVPKVSSPLDDRDFDLTSNLLSDLNISTVSDSYADDDSVSSGFVQSRVRWGTSSHDRLPSGYTVQSMSSESSKSTKTSKSSKALAQSENRDRRMGSPLKSKIPWDMLDGLDAETRKFKESMGKIKHSFHFAK